MRYAVLCSVLLLAAVIAIPGAYQQVAFAAYDAGEQTADRHAPPLQQQREGVPLSEVQCNAPRELYILDSQHPLCVFTDTYELLSSLGAELSMAPEPDTVTIGLLAPISGGAAGYGEDIAAGAALSLDDFNEFLQHKAKGWRLDMEVRDSETNPDVLIEELMSLNGQGIGIVSGPSIDIYGQEILDYADSNEMLLVSCCSALPGFAIPGDSLFRMTPDQTNHGRAIADLMYDEGIRVVVPAGRDNLWITDIMDPAGKQFLGLGGEVFDEKVLYDISGEFTGEDVQRLADRVSAQLESYDQGEIAVLYIAFEETYDFIEQASGHAVLGDVRWFGADANTILHSNAAALGFADAVDFTSVQPTAPESEARTEIESRLVQELGRTPSTYALSEYDAIQLIGRAILKSMDSPGTDIREVFAQGAESYDGVSGTISLNEAGDRDSGLYAVWEYVGDAWSKVGEYDTSTGLTAEEEAWLLENPVIRVAHDSGWVPIEYADESGRIAGVTAKYMAEVEKATGADLVGAGSTSWSHALEQLENREADIAFMIVDTPERSEYLGFTTPHYTVSTSLVALEEGHLDMGDEGLRIVTIRDYAIEGWLDENRPDVQYISVDGFAEGLELLQADGADAFAAMWLVVQHVAGSMGITVYDAGPTGYEYDVAVGYRSDQPLLGSIMQKTLDGIPQSVLEGIQGTVSEYDTSTGLTAEEEAWLLENPVIRVAHDPGWVPIEYADESGRIAGVTAKYMAEVEKATGADLVGAGSTSWSHALEQLQNREADIAFMIADTPERSEYLGFTTPHYTVSTSLVALEEGHLDMGDEGLRIVTIRDYAIEGWLDENHPDVQYISVDGFAEGLELLQADGADALAATWLVVQHVAGSMGITVYDAGPTGHEYDLTVGYRSDQPLLGSIMQKTLDGIPQSVLEGIQAGSNLTAEEEAWLLENPVIRVAHDPGWVPIEYADESGRIAGVTAKYMAEVEKATGADLVGAGSTSWSHALEQLQNREADIAFMIADTPERSEYLGFTTPHYTVSTSLVALEEGHLDIGDEGLRIVTIRDYAIEEWLDENHPDVQYISVGGFAEGLELLQADGADAFAATWLVVQHVAGSMGITVYDAGPTSHEYDLAVGYRSDQPLLGSIMQKTLDGIPQSVLEGIQGTASE